MKPQIWNPWLMRIDCIWKSMEEEQIWKRSQWFHLNILELQKLFWTVYNYETNSQVRE